MPITTRSHRSWRRKACLLSLSSLLTLSLLSPAQAALEDALKPFPADTTGIVTVDIRPETWLPLLQLNPEALDDADFKDLLKSLNEEFGLDFATEVLPYLGTHFAVGYGYGQDETMPLPLFALHIKDEAAIRKLLDKVQAKIKAEGGKIYPAKLQGLPVAKLDLGGDGTAWVALTPNALIGSFETKPEMLTRALNSLKVQGGLLNRAEFSAHQGDATQDAVWFYGKTPRLFADILSADAAGADKRAQLRALQQLFSLFDGSSMGLRFSDEGLLFHSRNLYSKSERSPSQEDYLDAVSSPAGVSLEPLLKSVPARSYGVVASDRLGGLFTSPLSNADGPGTAKAREQYNAFQLAKLIQDLSGWKPAQYLHLLDGRFSVSMLPHKEDADFVLAIGLKPGEEQAMAKLMAGLKLDVAKLQDLVHPLPERQAALNSATRGNLRDLHMMSELYSVYNDGRYPLSLAQLEKDAKAHDYWKPMQHPLGKPYALGDFRKLKAPSVELAGQVFYEPLKPGKNGAQDFRALAYLPDGSLAEMRKNSYEQPIVRSGLPTLKEPVLPKLGFVPGPDPYKVGMHQLEPGQTWKKIVGAHHALPSYAVSQNLLLLASSPAALEVALASQHEQTPSLLDDPSWKERSQRHLAQNSAYLFYANLDQLRSEVMANDKDETISEILQPLHYLFGSGSFRRDGDESQGMLNIDLAGIAKTLRQNTSGAGHRARVSSVKANMHTLQTMIETYAVDWGGCYPDNLEAMREEAIRQDRQYWRDLKNPFTDAMGIGFRGAMVDYSEFVPGAEASGLAIYKPKPPAPGESCIVSYEILGSDGKGELIQDKDSDFTLSNS